MNDFRGPVLQQRAPGRRRQRIAALALAGLVSAGASAQAAFSVIASEGEKQIALPATDIEPLAYDHFPGSAWFYAVEDEAAPAPGVTGTATLPEMPADAALSPSSFDGTVIPAASTVFRGHTGIDSARALECLTAAIYYEAASESDDGQRAVAQVILNRVRHPAFPNSVCGVVYQGSERATGCQFSYSCDGAMARKPSLAGWARARRIAGAALSGYVYAPAGLATHYHTFAVKPRWSSSLVMTAAVGAHFFHRWKGWWGTAAAFSQRYSGVEPFPGPKRAAAPLVVASAQQPAPKGFAPQPVPSTRIADIQPTYVASGAAREDALPAESQIQDKYRDSGTWIAR